MDGVPKRTLAGQQVGRYTVIRQIGRGGMGEVYLAEDSQLNRRVALKMLRSEFISNTDRLHRFEQEACAASALNHPYILTIHEVGEADGLRFIATEYVEGVTLRQRMSEERMELREVLDITTQMASALAAAHEAGIIHRDIKPENIMLRPDGYIKVLDFGLAKLTGQKAKAVDHEAATARMVQTESGVGMGTATYMSPEQVRALKVDSRTDIWSLGVVLYEMVASKPPFQGASTSDVIASILKTEPPPLLTFAPQIPAELQRIVRKALRKDREERYQTIRDMALDLKQLKHELVFDLEHLAQAVSSNEESTRDGGQETKAARKLAAQAENVAAEGPTSRFGYIFSEIKSHKTDAAIIVLLLAIVASLVFFGLSQDRVISDSHKQTQLGDKKQTDVKKEPPSGQLTMRTVSNTDSRQWLQSYIRLMTLEGQSLDPKIHILPGAVEYIVQDAINRSFVWSIEAIPNYELETGRGFRITKEGLIQPLDLKADKNSIKFTVPMCDKDDRLIAVVLVTWKHDLEAKELSQLLTSKAI